MAAASRAEWHGKLARRYLIQLCKHFQHRLAVTINDSAPDAASGSIGFDSGTCTLHAEGETLTLVVTADDASNLEPLQGVVTRHFERFAFREEMKLAWAPA